MFLKYKKPSPAVSTHLKLKRSWQHTQKHGEGRRQGRLEAPCNRAVFLWFTFWLGESVR